MISCGGLEPEKDSGSPVQVRFLWVGQGDATLLSDSHRRHYLVDTGDRLPLLRQELAPGDTIQALVLTHGDRDHMGVAAWLLDSLVVRTVFLPLDSGRGEHWTTFKESLQRFGGRRDTLFYGDTLDWGDFAAQVLWPVRSTDLKGNDLSTVIQIHRGSQAILLTGDIEAPAERAILRLGVDIRADVLKVPHHGSRTSSSLPFLMAVQPSWAIISADSSSYGHPHPETVAGLARFLPSHHRLLRTESMGTLVMYWEPGGIRWAL